MWREEVRDVLAAFLGALVVLVLGWLLGRLFERASRSIKDRTSTRATFMKAHKTMVTQVRKTSAYYFVFVAFLIAILVGILNYPR